MSAWWRAIDGSERRTLAACFTGWALDGFDAQLFSFAMPAIAATFALAARETGLLATVALATSALGGWLAGILADRYGRVRILKATILWFATFTALSAFAGSYGELLVLRAAQGLGFGGEWAAGSVLIGEVIDARFRARAVGTVQSAWAVGWALAALVATVALQALPEHLAWRVLFAAGFVPAVFVFLLRGQVAEPPAFRALDAGRPASSPLAIFGALYRRTTLLGSLLAIGAQGGYYTLSTWLPTYLRTERHLTVLASGGYLAVIIGGAFAGYLASASLSDALGRRGNFVLFALGSLVIAVVYTQPFVSDRSMLFLGAPLGFFSSGLFSGMGALYTELYPTALRAGGQGFCYNAGRGIAALLPWVVGILSAHAPLALAMGLLAGVSYALVVLVALILPETRGRPLPP